MAKKNKQIRGKIQKAQKTFSGIEFNSDTECPIWLFDLLDRSGPFAFDTSRPDFQHKEFLDKMIAYSNMTWAEIKQQTHDKGKSKHHMLDESGFSPAAWERVKAKHLEEETDAIFSFALQNLLRIIGIRRNAEFHVVWYDPKHQFYPSKK